jgi:hypothetical protein
MLIVFLGPTLDRVEARTELEAEYLAPASQGDVYRAALRRPQAIGIIDGYFERVPSVWHKEILWAMAEGIHVFGSASMGALRAAELAPFGMEGVGAIFEAFRDGSLEDDDEVAVAHATADLGFRSLSEPMVNIRATLQAATKEGIISQHSCGVMLRGAKNLYYADRVYPRIIRQAAQREVPESELEAFAAWLPTGRVDQKREDALSMLRAMRQHVQDGLPAKQVEYWFEDTEAWEHVQRTEDGTPNEGAILQSLSVEDVLDELRLLDPREYARLQTRATARILALDASRHLGFKPDSELLRQGILDLRRELGLLEPKAVDWWMQDNHLTREQLVELIDADVRLAWVAKAMEMRVKAALVDELRRSGQYRRLVERARVKRSVLDCRGLSNTTAGDADMDEQSLVNWYFERLQEDAPVELAEYARRLGLDSSEAFLRLISREAYYLRSKAAVPMA